MNIVDNLSNIQKSRYWFKMFPKGLVSLTDEPVYIKIFTKIIRVLTR